MGEFIFGALLVISFCAGFLAGIGVIKQEAIDRGYMVQCIGKSGWHWECEEKANENE